ncbi:hypothetical protein JXZ92_00370 [Mycoplasma sp. CSL10137]|nr:hypothetical protein [Mycoplasma sp. CSL10137]
MQNYWKNWFKNYINTILIDNEERYKCYWDLDKKQKRNRRPDRYGYTLLKKLYKRYNMGMNELKAKSWKRPWRPKKLKLPT